jgi:protein involved in sex pheromone biosynthesis
MLTVTPDSFVCIYTVRDVYVLPASSVTASLDSYKDVKYQFKNFSNFFTDYLKSFIGDINLNDHTDDKLKELQLRANARDVLILSVVQE